MTSFGFHGHMHICAYMCTKNNRHTQIHIHINQNRVNYKNPNVNNKANNLSFRPLTINKGVLSKHIEDAEHHESLGKFHLQLQIYPLNTY